MRQPAPAALLLALAAGLAGCGDALGPLPAEGRARELVYEFSGWPDFQTRVRLVGDTVTYFQRGVGPADEPVTVTGRRVPSAEEWRTFWREVDVAGVRRWPARCANTDVQDGGGYEFRLAWEGGRRAGTYVNAAPTAAGRCSRDDFGDSQRFVQAVRALAGYGAVDR